MPIYILPLPAGLPRRVGDILGHDGSWSPNGEQIVYARGNELFLAKPDGSESRRLVTLTASASRPRWSPDGKVLRFTEYDAKTSSTSLWEVASDGTGLRPLLPGWSSSPARVLRQLDPGRELLCVSVRSAGQRNHAFGRFGRRAGFCAGATQNQPS